MFGGPTLKYSGRGRQVSAEPGEERGNTRIAACTEEHLAHINAILELSPEAAAWKNRSLIESFKQHPACFLVAWQDKEIAGFICGRSVIDEGEILNLAVKPEFRRQGVGGALIRALLDVFASQQISQVFLEVRKSNTSALSLYQRLGFRQIGERPDYYRNPVESAIVLSLSARAI